MNDKTGQATYSPEDNKLRLYPDGRLDAETYGRVKAAGFIWAAKQGLFVAPMWTPERENLLIELCGEIEDEDKSLVDRAAERAERFEDYSEHRAQDADGARAAVSSIADNIPLGQPILVGHHSERHARRDAEKIENGMRKAVRMWECSKYWESRAKGALRHAKYKERPDVRARRIKGIDADQRKQERFVASYRRCLRFWNGEMKFRHTETREEKLMEISEENRASICKILGSDPDFGYLPVAPTEHGSHWSAWDALRPDEDRYKACPSLTVAQCQEIALRHYPALIERAQRWVNHCANRLSYERAMLEESGGTITDQKGPQKGGACKCWASPRGGWSYIQKVNKVSVTVLDNWGNSGANFTRTIPFDKLSGIMTAAEVEEARREGRLIESQDKIGFGLCMKDPTPAPEVKTAPAPSPFEAMKQTLKAGVQVVSAPQLFPTPAPLAKRVVELADIRANQRVLEPSAGTGSLLTAILSADPDPMPPYCGGVIAIEINDALAEQLGKQFPLTTVLRKDFLSCNGELGKFDRIVMNPPFADGADIKHIEHARHMLAPGGRLVAICANGPRQRAKLMPEAVEWIDLEPGAFAESGTNVNAAIAIFTA